MINDFLYTGQLVEHKLTFSYAVTTQLVNEAVLGHDCDPPAAHLLGRALTGGLLVASLLKENERSNLHWKYEGVVRSVVVDAGQDGKVRGLISPRHLSEHGESQEVYFGDNGLLNHVRTCDGQILTSSTSEAPLHDVIDDLVYALCVSDQVESAGSVLIGFQPDVAQPVSLCQGILLQAMPDADLIRFDQVRARLAEPEVRTLLSQPSELDNYFERILKALTGQTNPVLEIDEHPRPRFECLCNRNKLVTVVQTLPPDDRLDIVAKGEALSIRCEFCNKKFSLSVTECEAIWAQECK